MIGTQINDENYIQIQGWMISKLKLKGNELLIYAIIYGFSQDGCSKFDGGLQYLANWTNSTKQGCLKNLKSLMEKKLIGKDEVIKNNTKFCSYFCYLTEFNTIKQSLTLPIKQSLINNLNNNINIISPTNNDFNFNKNKNETSNTNNIIKEKKLTKKQLKEKELLENETKINEYLEQFTKNYNEEIKQLIYTYVDLRKQKGLTYAQLVIILTDFAKECNQNNDYMINCLRKAIAGGWSQIIFTNKFSGDAKSSYSSFDNTAQHFTGNPKINDLDFRFMTFEARKDYISNMALADMTKDQKEFFEKYCLARDDDGNLLEF